jgi:hypothetical protein
LTPGTSSLGGWYGAYLEKKLGEGKHYLTALTAVERKLIHLVYAVWTRGTPFERRQSPEA